MPHTNYLIINLFNEIFPYICCFTFTCLKQINRCSYIIILFYIIPCKICIYWSNQSMVASIKNSCWNWSADICHNYYIQLHCFGILELFKWTSWYCKTLGWTYKLFWNYFSIWCNKIPNTKEFKEKVQRQWC